MLKFAVNKTKTRRKSLKKRWEAERIISNGAVYFLMTDSICQSSLPRKVLEKMTLTTIQFRIHPRTKVDPMFQCVYISTPLKSCPYNSSATCAWSMARVAEKTLLDICANNKGTDPHRLISAFVVHCSSFFFFFSTKKRITNLNGEQNDTWNLLVSHRIWHFRTIQPFDYLMWSIFWYIKYLFQDKYTLIHSSPSNEKW